MEEKKLFLEPIMLEEGITLQIDPDNTENLLIMRGNETLEVYSLTRRIYTLFRMMYQFTDCQVWVHDHKEQRLYGRDIEIKDGLFMHMTNQDGYHFVEFFKRLSDGDIEIHYLAKATATTKTLFEGMSIALAANEDKSLRTRYPKIFKDMIDVLSRIQI